MPKYIENEEGKHGEARYMTTRRDLRRLLEKGIVEQAGEDGNGNIEILYDHEVVGYVSCTTSITMRSADHAF